MSEGRLLPEPVETFALQYAWREGRPHSTIVAHTMVADNDPYKEYFLYMHDPKGFDYGLILTERDGVLKEIDQNEARRFMKKLGS